VYERRRAAYSSFVEQIDGVLRRDRFALTALRSGDMAAYGSLAAEGAEDAQLEAGSSEDGAIHFTLQASLLAASICRRMQWVALSFQQLDHIAPSFLDGDLMAVENLLDALQESRREFVKIAEDELN
jgi:hypothetical protein